MDTPGHQGFHDFEEAAIALYQTACIQCIFKKIAVRGQKLKSGCQ